MDYKHKEEEQKNNIIETKSIQNDINIEMSVDDLTKSNKQEQLNTEKVDKIRIVAEEDEHNDQDFKNENPLMFIKRPVPHISRNLAIALTKVYSWKSLKAESSQPVHDAIADLLRAETESEFSDALVRVIKKSVAYMDIRSGHRKNVFGSGEERKEDIRTLLKEIAVYSANGGSALLTDVNNCIESFDKTLKYGRLFKTQFKEAVSDKYGDKLNSSSAEELAKAKESKMEKDLKDWGGSCQERAKTILENRAKEIPEFELSAGVLSEAIRNITIPDVKTLNDYELLTFGNIENYRSEVYIPLSQNLERLISAGQIQDLAEIVMLRAKMETLRAELDVYDARIRQMAERADEVIEEDDANKEIINKSLFLEDLEKKNLTEIHNSMKNQDLLNDFKAYSKIISPKKKLSKEDLAHRLFIIEQNRARKEYFSKALLNSKEIKINGSKKEKPQERYQDYRNECKRILNIDYSALFNIRLDRNGLLEDCSKNFELIGMLGNLDQLLNSIKDCEKTFSDEFKKHLASKDQIIMESEKQELETLFSLGKLFKSYMDTMQSFMNTIDAYPVLDFSDFNGLSEDRRRKLLQRPYEFREGHENEFRVYEAFSRFQELSDIQAKLSAEFGEKVDTIKLLREQNSFWDAKFEEKKEQREQFNELKEASKLDEKVESKKKSIDMAAVEDLKKNTIHTTDPALIIEQIQEKKRKVRERQKKQFEAAKEAFKEDKQEKGKKKSPKRSNERDYTGGLMEYAIRFTDPALVMEQFKKNEIDRALKKDINMVIASYGALSGKDAKKGDEVEVRKKCVTTISTLSGIDEKEFEFIPTKIITDKLKKIDSGKPFDKQSFSKDIREMLDDGLDTEMLSKTLVPLCSKKEFSFLDKLEMREYSMYTINSILERYVTDKKSLEQYDTDFMAKIALGLLAVDDIDMDDEENPPTKEEAAKMAETSAIILSTLTGKQKDVFSFVPAKDLSKIMYEATSRLGSKLEITPYVEEQLIIERRKEKIRNGLKSYDEIDKKTAKKADLDNARKEIIETLCALSETEEKVFDLLPTNVLYTLLKDSMIDAIDAKKLKNSIIESAEFVNSALNIDTMGKELSDLMADKDVSQEMIDYLSAEYDICIYANSMKELGRGKSSYSRKDFEDTSYLHDANLMAFLYLHTDLENREYDAAEDFRNEISVMLSLATGIEKAAFLSIPVCDLKEMGLALIDSAKDKTVYENKAKELPEAYKNKYKGENVLDRMNSLMDEAHKIEKAKKPYEINPALRDLKEIAMHYLIDIAGVKDISRKELEKLPGMRLYTLVYETLTHEKDKPEIYEENKDLYKCGKKAEIAGCEAKLKEIEKTIRLTEKKRDEELTPINKKIEELVKKTAPGKENKKLNKAIEAKKLLVSKYADEIAAYEKTKKSVLDKKDELNEKLKKYIDETTRAYQRDKEYQSSSVAKFSLEREEQWKEEVEGLNDIAAKKYTAREKKMSKKVWSNDAQNTLAFFGDLVSGIPVIDENGKEISKENRIKAVLMNNAALITTILNERKGKNSSKGVLKEIKQKLSRGGNRLLTSLIDNFLDDVLAQFETISNKQGDFKVDDVRNILGDDKMTEYLQGADKTLEKAILLGEKHINSMISEAADNLFGDVNELPEPEDEVLKYIYNELYGKDQREAVYPSYKRKPTGKEKLAKLRNSVFDTEKGQGKFLKLVIKDYYKSVPLAQRRFMMSYMMKDMQPSKMGNDREDGAAFFASMLKGAGPLMQKLFQGVPENMLMKPFRPALSVVKSDLRDIQPEYVDKQLKLLVQNANDNLLQKKSRERVTKITKQRSLGAASIAQTFLCDVTYSGPGGERVEQVVVKIMRPDVNMENLETERKFVEKCAKTTDTTGVMLASFSAHYKKIKEELDFNNEIKNARIGKSVYENANVRSVQISENIPSGKHYLVMDKAEGITADRYIEQLKAFSEDVVQEFKNTNPNANKPYSTTVSNWQRRNEVRKQIADKLIEAQACQKNMEELVKNWVTHALFSSLGDNQFFHHGDLHAGNIMVNKDYVTVLDYGNCTTLDNTGNGLVFKDPGRVDNIIKMMSAAYKGFSDDFVEYLEAFIKIEGDQNKYNSMDPNKKAEMKDRLKAELKTIFRLGSEENTGERIFVALLKAQEIGFILPQEMLNFSQCQQRLENSLAEFNNAIVHLRDALDIIDSMPVTDFSETHKRIDYDPELLIISNLLRSDNSDEATNLVIQKYAIYSDLDGEELRKDLRNPDKSDLIQQGIMLPYLTVKDRIENSPIKGILEKFHKNFSTWNKDFKDYRAFEGVNPKDLSQKEFDRFKKLEDEFTGIPMLLFDLSSDPDFTDVLGGINKLSNLATSAARNFDQDSWDELYRLMETKLYKMKGLADTFVKYQETLKKNKNKINAKGLEQENNIIDSLCQMHVEDAIESEEINKLSKGVSADLVNTSYFCITEDNISTKLDKKYAYESNSYLSKVTVKDKTGKPHEEFVYGEKAEYLEKIWNKILEMKQNEASLDPEQTKEMKKLLHEASKIASIVEIDLVTRKSEAQFEKELADIFKDDSPEGKQFRQAYKTHKELQKRYIEARYKDARSDTKPLENLKTLKEKRIKANRQFLESYRVLARRRIQPLYDIYKDYLPKQLGDFVDVMEDVLLSNKRIMLLTLGKDAPKYLK